MKAFVFPGQASQFVGMGKDLYDSNSLSKELFEEANDILDFRLSDIMFEGKEEDLQRTDVTQPAVFLHSVAVARANMDSFHPEAVAGHSLGEISALVAAQAMTFADGMNLVRQRSFAMQKACLANPGTMAAIIGLADDIVEDICNEIDEIVVAANYNCPGQLVISGTLKGVEIAVDKCKEKGARMAVILAVGGAFHSPLMKPAEEELKVAIQNTNLVHPICPIYQNFNAKATSDPEEIKNNLIAQLTAPVLWTKIMENMKADGLDAIVEVGGNGKTLQAFFKRFDKTINTSAL